MACVKRGPHRYGYQDGELVYLLADRMNFTPVYVQDSDGVTYGKEEHDGHFSGSLGAVENNKVDIGGNIRVITNLYRTRNLLFLRPIGSTKLMYIVPKNYLKRNFAVFPLHYYTAQVVVLYVVTFISLSLVFYCIKCCSARHYHREDVDLLKIILTMIGIHHSISVKTDFTSTKKRIVLGTAFLYAVILSSMYQGNIVKELNNIDKNNDIKTFEQLINTPLQLLIHADLAVHIEYFKEFSQQSIFNHLFKRNTIIPNEIDNPGDFVAYNRTAALLTLDMYAPMHKIGYFDKESGEERIELLAISVKEFFNSITVPKTSPFIGEINYWLSRFDQAGLLSHQNTVAESDLKREYIKYAKLGLNPNSKLRILTFEELYSLFLFMLVFYVCGIVVLLCEILWHRRHDLCKNIIHPQ